MAFNGSARKDGNTAILINYVLKELQQEGIETELFQLAGQKIQGCMACYKCFENKDRECVFKDDILNRWDYSGVTHLFHRCQHRNESLDRSQRLRCQGQW
jgi:multimeric flavodoxin WrbA